VSEDVTSGELTPVRLSFVTSGELTPVRLSFFAANCPNLAQWTIYISKAMAGKREIGIYNVPLALCEHCYNFVT
jgi:hypothetical protein